MRIWLSLALVSVLAIVSACGSRTVAAPTATLPHYPDFVQPRVPADLADSPAVASHDRAWQFLQAGELHSAEREVAAALRSASGFYPSETTSAYIDVARKDYRAAVVKFDRALALRPDYAAALAGKGEALVALGRDDDAIEAFDAALVADPSLTDLQRRVAVLKFQRVQRDVTAARQAVQAGKYDDALQTYRAAIERSPDSALLYHELATLERDQGNGDAAIEHYRQAATLDPSDPTVLVDLAGTLDARNDFDAALKAYDEALAMAPDPEVAARREALRSRAEIAGLPPEYRAIESAPQVSRGELAALIGLRLAPLLESTSPRNIGVITDIRNDWAEPWILSVVRAGVMGPFANHTFQPRTAVRRVDFAQTVTRLLAKVATVEPSAARAWQNARGRFPDITSAHIAYPAASMATASGVMTTAPDGSFQPSRLVTGEEATVALERLRVLANVTPAASARP
jgi:tetratricopeptide (TPR) repeat protein